LAPVVGGVAGGVVALLVIVVIVTVVVCRRKQRQKRRASGRRFSTAPVSVISVLCARDPPADITALCGCIFSLYVCQRGYDFIGVCLFVSRNIFTQFGENKVYGPRERPLNFGGNPDHVITCRLLRRTNAIQLYGEKW